MISIIISTKNKSSKILERTLASVKNALTEKEIIIIDQNQGDNGIQTLVERAKSFDRENSYIYIKDNNTGLSAGRNLGLQFASRKWICFLDDDAILPEKLNTSFINLLSTNEDNAIVFYGRVLELETHQPFIKRNINVGRLYYWNFDSVCSVTLLFNRKVFDHIGNFDKQFGVGAHFGAGEESDILLRALMAKIIIEYSDDIIIYHPKETCDSKKKFSYGHGLGALYRKHIFNSLYLFAVMSIKLVFEILLRSGLALLHALIDINKSKAHINYLRGFIKGFYSYS